MSLSDVSLSFPSLSSDSLMSSELSALYMTEQVNEMDKNAIEQLSISGITLMKLAGRHAFLQLLAEWPEAQHLHIVCGSGNNAGDGYVVAALAKQRNMQVTLWVLTDPNTLGEDLNGSAKLAYHYAIQENVVCMKFEPLRWQHALATVEQTVIVDALLGTGAKGVLSPAYTAAIHSINTADCAVLAIDIPSGVNANTGAVDTVAVNADVTVSFIGQKRGLFTGKGRIHSGDRYFIDLLSELSNPVLTEFYDQYEPAAQLIHYQHWLALLPDRALDAHKGDCGHVLIVGGDCGASYGYGGAPIMAAEMALRTGAGLVSVATRPSFVAPVLARIPEAMVVGIDSGQALLPLLDKASGVVIGPGLGQSAWSEQLLYHVLCLSSPLIIDADALHLLARDAFVNLPTLPTHERPWILTPHPGEAAVLLGVSIADIEADRFRSSAAIQQRYGGTVILKGAGTIVTTSTGEQWLCDLGNPGMASGGMGDVLSGLLGSLVVQGMTPDAAALLGVSLHALAADSVVEEQGLRGLLATDLIASVRAIIDNKAPSLS